MRILLSLSILALSLSSTRAYSATGARIEPFVGFKSAAFTNKEQVGGLGLNLEGPFGGGVTGIRFGGRFTEDFGLGIEVAYGYLDQESDSFITKDLGVYAEHNFNIPLRTWLTYYFSSEAQSQTDSKLKSLGRGTKFGIGYTGFKHMSLNVEYLTLTFENQNTTSDADIGSILLSISSPFNI